MDIVIRATVLFFLVFGLLRLTGKRELSQFTPFDLVLLVVIGDLIQQGVTHNDFSMTGALIAIATFGFWSVTLGWLSYRSRRAESLLDGEPTVVIRDGELLEKNLRRDRLTRREVEAEMRLAGISRLEEVQWAVLEAHGKISFIARTPETKSEQKDERSMA